jgi:hypothetical protein
MDGATGQSGRKSFDDPAFGNGAAAALTDHAVEFPTQGSQICDLSIDLGPMFLGNGIDGFAGSIALVRQVEQCANLVERESEIARAPD